MTTATATPAKNLSPVSYISTPGLSDKESASVLVCINALRARERVYLVRVLYDKQGESSPRIAGEDYVPDPTLVRNAHEGIIYAAPTNRDQQVYLRLLDGARRPDQEDNFGHTCLSLAGLRSFRVLGEFAGPAEQERQRRREHAAALAAAQERAQLEAQKAAQQPQGFPNFPNFNLDPRLLMAQTMFAQAQTLILMAQTLTAQAQESPR